MIDSRNGRKRERGQPPDTQLADTGPRDASDTSNPADDAGHDLLSEECMSFARAARRLPKVRGEKHPSPSTLWRWAKNGRRSCNGTIVYLECVRVGGTNCTSMEALRRFFARLNGTNDRPAGEIRGTSATPKTSDQKSLAKRAGQATEILRRRGLI